MAKALDIIGVLIRKVVAAGIRDISVDDCYLLVIPVIEGHLCHAAVDRVEDAHLNAAAPDISAECLRVDAQCPKIVKQQLDLYALLRLLREHLEDITPDLPVGHDEIFHKDKFLSVSEILEHRRKDVLTHPVVGCLRIVVDGKSFFSEITADLHLIRMLPLQILHDAVTLFQALHHLVVIIPQAPEIPRIDTLAPPHKIQEKTRDRQYQYDDNPAHLVGFRIVHQRKYDDHTHQLQDKIHNNGISHQIHSEKDHQGNLQKK